MRKQEFIDKCVLNGYANRKIATKYAEQKDKLDEHKDIFTEEDFIEVHRVEQSKYDIIRHSSHLKNYQGTRTSKRLKNPEYMGDDGGWGHDNR